MSEVMHPLAQEASHYAAFVGAEAELARLRAMVERLDADLAKARPEHFSIGLMRGRLREMLPEGES